MEQNSFSRRLFLGGSLATAAGALVAGAGCSSGGSSNVVILPPEPFLANAVLRASQEVGVSLSTARGTADITIPASGLSIQLNASLTGVLDAVAAHIHVGRPGSNGPVIFTLFDSATATSLTSINRTLTENQLQAQPAAGVTTFTDAVNAVLGGRAYINVHTQSIPAGAIRGQIGGVNLFVILNGASMVPPVTTNAAASILFRINARMAGFSISMEAGNVVNSTGAKIRVGAPDANGPIIFNITDEPVGNSLSRNFVASNLITQAGAGILNFNDALNALLSGNTYVEFTNQANPSGIIRGQLTTDAFVGSLRGASEVPAVTTTAIGTLVASLSKDKLSLSANLRTEGLTNVQMAHLHVGPVGQNGPPLFTLYTTADGAFGTGVTKVLTQANLVAGGGVNTFADFIVALKAGNIYANVHTQARPNGEIRGQLIVQL